MIILVSKCLGCQHRQGTLWPAIIFCYWNRGWPNECVICVMTKNALLRFPHGHAGSLTWFALQFCLRGSQCSNTPLRTSALWFRGEMAVAFLMRNNLLRRQCNSTVSRLRHHHHYYHTLILIDLFVFLDFLDCFYQLSFFWSLLSEALHTRRLGQRSTWTFVFIFWDVWSSSTL